MLVKTYSAIVQGLQAMPVTVEVNAARGIRFVIVGLPDNAVKESYERIMAAIDNSGYSFPSKQITVNLAPVDVRKEGSGFDLPIAIAILATDGKVDSKCLNRYMMVGELSLDGSVVPVRGVLPIAIKAREMGYDGIFVPEENVHEAAVVNKIHVYGVRHIGQVVGHLNGNAMEPMVVDTRADFYARQGEFEFDFSDVKGQESVCFSCELRSSDFLGSITFGAVDIYAYPKGDTSVPQEGLANINKEQVAKLKSPASLMTNILPYSVRGVAKAKNTLFTGESSYITFSMGGEKFSEGLILASGANFFDDNIDAYATFDLAGEFDYISFYAGMLTNRRVLEDDRLRIYADDKLIFDTVIHCTEPNKYFEVPVNKCRSLRFAKPGNKKQKQCFIGVGDIALYRGKPVKNDLFYHEYPDFPEEADLIDLCQRPYFHYVGRYLSSLTNFDFNDCFKPGGTKRDCFNMKDGSPICKGVMLEANVPLAFEDITMTDAAIMFLVGAGSALSQSDMAAYTGTTAGAGLAGDLAVLKLINPDNKGQASVVAFNPYGEYQSCTFSIANKAEYWDEVDKLVNLGERKDHPFRLNVIADQRLVKQIELTNRMEPQTITVPIHNCHSLVFWLEPGDTRSGQFVLYDMTVSKQPYTPAKQCWEVTFTQDGAAQTVYGWLTEQELLENIAEMRADSSVSNISYRPAKADDRDGCEKLFDSAKK